VSDIWDVIGDEFDGLASDDKAILVEYWENFKEKGVKIAKKPKDVTKKIIDEIKAELGSAWDTLSERAQEAIAEHWGGALLQVPTGAGHQSMLQARHKWGVVGDFWNMLVDKVYDTLTDMKTHLGSAWNSLSTGTMDVISEHWTDRKNEGIDLGEIKADIEKVLGSVWNTFTSAVQDTIAEHWDISSTPSMLQVKWGVPQWAKDTWDNVVNTVSNIWDVIGDEFDGLASDAKAILVEYWEIFKEKGVRKTTNTAKKIIDEIKATLGSAWDTLSERALQAIAEHWGGALLQVPTAAGHQSMQNGRA